MSSSSGLPVAVVLLFLAIPVVFAVVGTAFVVAGVRTRRATARFERIAVRVPGQCVDLRLRSRQRGLGERHSAYHPILAFATLDGRQMTVESPWGGIPTPARPGQPVTVLYDPQQPARARVDGLMGRGTFFSVVLILMGGVFAVIGWLVLLGVGYAVTT